MSISTLLTASGWHNGISSWVFLAAMMPAMRATPSTSPFLALPERTRSSVAALMRTKPAATATRSVAGFSDTSTMRAAPPRSIWVRFFAIASARRRGRRVAGRIVAHLAAPDERPRRRRNLGLPYQAFADQERGDAGRRKPCNIRGREDAAFAHDHAIARHHGGETFGDVERGDEGLEVAVIDTEKPR